MHETDNKNIDQKEKFEYIKKTGIIVGKILNQLKKEIKIGVTGKELETKAKKK